MDKEDLKYTLDRTTELVRNADSKNNVMVAIAAALAAVLFANNSFVLTVLDVIAVGGTYPRLLLFGAIISLFVFIGALFISLFPSVKCSQESNIYAGRIAERCSAECYQDKIESDDYDLTKDLVCQIYTNSLIFKKKSILNKIAAYGLFFLIIFVILLAFCNAGGI